MSIVPGRNHCVTCDKQRATLRCGGCLQEFCFNHSTDHRQQLSQQLDQVEVTRDLFRQTLTYEQTNNPEKHTLIEEINEWERDSIIKIQETAAEAKQAIIKHTTDKMKQIEVDLNKLTDALRQSREENDYFETDIRQWNEELTQLTKQLNKPSDISLQKNFTSFINKISVDIKSKKPPLMKDDLNIDNSPKGFANSRKITKNENKDLHNDEDIGERKTNRNESTRVSGDSVECGTSNRLCYNCAKTGHFNRDCPEARIPNRDKLKFSLDGWHNYEDFQYRRL